METLGGDRDEQWAPVSDLMAVLMLIFLFISVIYVRSVALEADVNRQECEKIYYELDQTFGPDFEVWDVELLEDLTIRFRNPEILFEPASTAVKPGFAPILMSFFPRYLDILAADYRADIREIRIEGHTSSDWIDESPGDAYLLNMELSHGRSLEILRFVLSLPSVSPHLEWARPLLTANGLSSSKLIRDPAGGEDVVRSRRVEFRLMAASCQRAGLYDSPTLK